VDIVDIQDQLSRSVYHAKGVEVGYRDWGSVPIYEAKVLLKYQPDVVGRDILDLGVGTGRTTRYLAPLARRYEGIDFSPVMVDAAHRLMPSASVHLGDMRDLSVFPDASFDFVFGSNNVISAVGHADRLRVVAEVHRVLRAGGKFVFTCHNRGYSLAGAGPRLELHRNPVTSLRDLLRYVKRQINHARVRKFRRRTDEYDLFDDVGHDFSLLHYYIDRPHAQRQLEDAGFGVLDVLDPFGDSLAAGDLAEHAPFLLYVAEKRPGGPGAPRSSASETSGHVQPGTGRAPATKRLTRRATRPSPGSPVDA